MILRKVTFGQALYKTNLINVVIYIYPACYIYTLTA